MKLLPISSSSDGNCTLIEGARTRLLIDCGISLRALKIALGDEAIRGLDAVFVTHEHGDHVKGIPSLSKRVRGLPVYVHTASYRTRNGRFKGVSRRELNDGESVEVGEFVVTPLKLEHDAENTFGFMIEGDGGGSLCYLADTGFINGEARKCMERAGNLLIETNYDERLLRDYERYPQYLKKRIRSYHMGTRQTLDLVEEVGVDSFANVVCAHLSPRTNSPVHVRQLVRERFPDHHERFRIAPLDEALELF